MGRGELAIVSSYWLVPASQHKPDSEHSMDVEKHALLRQYEVV